MGEESFAAGGAEKTFETRRKGGSGGKRIAVIAGIARNRAASESKNLFCRRFAQMSADKNKNLPRRLRDTEKNLTVVVA